MPIYKSRRQHRYNKLKAELFTSKEARTMSTIAFKQPYIKEMRRDRRALAEQVYKYVRRNKLPRMTFLPLLEDRIDKLYRKQGWKDIWAMIRSYRDKSLARGDYQPPARKKRDRFNKGNVKAQKARHSARMDRKKNNQTGVAFNAKGKVVGRVVYISKSKKFEVEK
jgi:hypothetical protein